MDDILGIILLIVIFCLTPFAMAAIIKGIMWLWEKIQIKRGYIKARVILPNKREFFKLSKPDGKEIKIKLMGKEKSFEFRPEYLTYQGHTPIETWNFNEIAPVDPSDPKTKQPISSDAISNLIIRAYNLGIIAAMRDNKMTTLLLILCLACAGGALVMSLMGWSLMGSLGDKVTVLQTTVGNNTATLDSIKAILTTPVLK